MNGKLVALALLGSVGAGAAVGACSHGRSSAGSETEPQAATTVRVDNQNYQDFDVYVLGSGQRIRLGRVASLSTEVFTIPAAVVSVSTDLRFELHAIGARRNPRTERLLVRPGDQVQLTIPAY